MFVDAKNSVVLQTGKGYISLIHNLQICKAARMIFDSGSQKSYVSSDLQDALNLPTVCREMLTIIRRLAQRLGR